MAAMIFISKFVFSFSFCFSFSMILIGLAIAQPSLSYVCSNDKGNYTANSTYEANLHHILSSLPTENHFNSGFFNSSYGKNSDRVNAIGLCRGDVDLELCRTCLSDSAASILQLCPNQKEAVGWYDQCMLRYSYRSIFGVLEYVPTLVFVNTQESPDPRHFSQVVQNLLRNLTDKAASGNSQLMFAAGEVVVTQGFLNIYGAVQCTPDLTKFQCVNCINDAVHGAQSCCFGNKGLRVIRPSCNFRFEIYNFITSPEIPSASPSLSPPSPFQQRLPQPPSQIVSVEPVGNKTQTSQTVIVIVVPIVAVIIFAVLIVSLFIFLRGRKPRVIVVENDSAVDEGTELETLAFDISTVRAATDNFSDANNIGQGGFGAVYKGRLVNGVDIAVKRLSLNSMQGNDEFKNEVLIVAKLQHRNLVRLIGFCLAENEKILIYELLQNSSLDKFIFDPLKRPALTWQKRYKIIEGIARGLVYLHEDSQIRIIHRDLKASNILLDVEMNPKISDFGMARLFEQDQTQRDTRRIAGTHGYIAPEYAMRGNFSIKSDVYSYGVLVLEILSGQKNRSFHHGENTYDLISYAWRNWSEGTPQNLIDPSMRGGSIGEMTRCIHIGLLCVQENPTDRPSMDNVLLMLNSHSVTIPVLLPPALMNSGSRSDMPSQPMYRSHVAEIGSDESRSNMVEVSITEASISELYPR